MRTIQQILEKTKYTESDQELFWVECSIDFLYFAEHVLGFEIAPYHIAWYEAAEVYDRLGIEAFRGSGKTFFFSGYFVWKAIFRPGTEFLIVSNRLDQAKYIMRVINTMVGDNDILKQFMPTGKEQTWRSTERELVNKSIFYCRTYSETIRSIHPDYILCDEVGEYEDKVIFYTAILGTIQLKKGKVVGIGTRKSSIDLLAELKENPEYMFLSHPVEVNGKPLWPQKYTMEEADTDDKRSIPRIRAEMGELKYMQEYMLIPMSAANSIFPLEMTMKCVMNTQKYLPYARPDRMYYMGYDIASSPTGDWTVMTILESNETHKRVVMIKRFRDTFDNQKRIFREVVDSFRPRKICIDSTGIGEQQATELSKEFSGVELIKFTFQNKMDMLLDLRREFESFNMELPNSHEDDSYKNTQLLLAELHDMSLKVDIGGRNVNKFQSGKYDDMVISLALANKASISTFGNISFRAI